MNAQHLEIVILKAIARVTRADWLPCSVGDLRNLIREIDSSSANATITEIGEAILCLVEKQLVFLGKREDGGRRLPFDLQKQLDQGYFSEFFGRASFEVKLTHEGRKRVDDDAQSISTNDEKEDRTFARLAIEEARKSIPENDGKPHPLVGAVVVKNGTILARAHRGEAKGNHAEFIALEKRLSAVAIAGATVYTTLEPCTTRNHPKIPCAERLVERRVKRVVMGMLDPDPRITGKGQRRLRRANIATDFFPEDLMIEVEELNRDFTRHFEPPSAATDSISAQRFQARSAETLNSSAADTLGKHRQFALHRLEDIKEFGLVEIACYPLQAVEIPVGKLEEFVQRHRLEFSESMRKSSTVDVFQSGVSVGFPQRVSPERKSTRRITLYKDGLAIFDGLADTHVRGEKSLHGGWLLYEVQRQLQMVKHLLRTSNASQIRVTLRLENVESFELAVPDLSGLWLNQNKYGGPHEPIDRTVDLKEIHSHDGVDRNTVIPVAADIMGEVVRIFGRSDIPNLWDAEGKLLYVKGLENSR